MAGVGEQAVMRGDELVVKDRLKRGDSKIHQDEHRHIAYGTWFLRQAVAEAPSMGDVVRQTLRELLPAAAEALTPPAGADASMLGASADEIRSFALDGLTRRLSIIGVPLQTL